VRNIRWKSGEAGLGRWARKKRQTCSWYSGFVDVDNGSCRFSVQKTAFRPKPIEKGKEILLGWRWDREKVIFPHYTSGPMVLDIDTLKIAICKEEFLERKYETEIVVQRRFQIALTFCVSALGALWEYGVVFFYCRYHLGKSNLGVEGKLFLSSMYQVAKCKLKIAKGQSSFKKYTNLNFSLTKVTKIVASVKDGTMVTLILIKQMWTHVSDKSTITTQ